MLTLYLFLSTAVKLCQLRKYFTVKSKEILIPDSLNTKLSEIKQNKSEHKENKTFQLRIQLIYNY